MDSDFALYEKAYGVKLPQQFCQFMLDSVGAEVNAYFQHADLSAHPDEQEFFVWRIADVGCHRGREQSRFDVMIQTDWFLFNEQAIPKGVIAFAFSYQEAPYWIDLTPEGDGRIVALSDIESLPRTNWSGMGGFRSSVYIAEDICDFTSSLISDSFPP